ncbi:MAG: Ldh family oxidoreductase [Planctomycetota bacterium]|jgi:LDH2 family malate/lactate/ureidoglycolate dehydrogenase
MPESGVRTDVRRYRADDLRVFCRRTFEHFGVPEADADTAADVLAYSDLHGIDSHGVARLRTYFDMLSLGRINPAATVSIVRETPSTATVDGDNGLGLVVGPRANEIALEKARAAGSGWVSVCNTNHYGAAGYYTTKHAEAGFIGWSMTNSTKLVAPLWGRERMLGTNPISIAFPAGDEPMVVLDMATCAAAYGKVEIARRIGAAIPDGWAIDRDGRGTDDPDAMVEGGALLPLGSERERGGHKGYGLAVAVDILCAVLSGANWGPFCPPFALRQEIPARSVGKGIGHFFGSMDVSGFIELDEFRAQMDDLVRTLRGTPPTPDAPPDVTGPLIPGDPEREAAAERRVAGVPLVPAVADELTEIAAHIGCAAPERID